MFQNSEHLSRNKDRPLHGIVLSAEAGLLGGMNILAERNL